MSPILSNALSIVAATSPPQTSPQEMSDVIYGLLVFGGVIFVGYLGMWIFQATMKRKPLTLQNAPGRPNRFNFILFLLIFFLVSALVGLASVLHQKFMADPGPTDEIKNMVFSSLAGGVPAILLILWVAKSTFTGHWRRSFGLSLRHWFFDIVRTVPVYLAVTPVCLLIAWQTGVLLPESWTQSHPLLDALESGGLSDLWKLGVVFSAVVMAPILEELLYRGLLQSALRRYFSPWTTVALASVLFASAHFRQPQNLPALFVLAMVMGYQYERSGRLIPSILIHMLFNATMVLGEMLS